MIKPFILYWWAQDTHQTKYIQLLDMFDTLVIAEHKYSQDMYL